MRVSVMLDANGANTTAAAAVVAAGRHLELADVQALALGATGPVGQRVVRMLASAGSKVRVASRSPERAQEVCLKVAAELETADIDLAPVAVADDRQARAALQGVDVVVAAGASGIQLLSKDAWRDASSLRVAIDLNAVPPLGIEGIEVMDKAFERHGVSTYGAVGVGGTKMRIHKESIRRLFQRNDLVLDADEIFRIGLELEAARK
jgi:glutamyl-tRNA reductase